MSYVTATLRKAWEPDQNEYVTRWRGHESELPTAAAKFVRQYAFMQRLTKKLADADVPLLAGTDASIAMVIPGYSLPEELRLLVNAGLTPYQALGAATRNAAACMGRPGEFGVVARGRRADLVLVDQDPLANIAALSRPPVGIVLRGDWLGPPQIQRLRRGLPGVPTGAGK